MNSIVFRQFRYMISVPVMDIDIIDEDGKIVNTAIVVPYHNLGFKIYRRTKNHPDEVTYGSSPHIEIKSVLCANTNLREKEIMVQGLLALAISDHMFLMKNLLDIDVTCPLMDLTFRAKEEKDLHRFIKACTKYMISGDQEGNIFTNSME